jgi:hypothetical protein
MNSLVIDTGRKLRLFNDNLDATVHAEWQVVVDPTDNGLWLVSSDFELGGFTVRDLVVYGERVPNAFISEVDAAIPKARQL